VRVRGIVAAGPTDFDDAFMYARYAHNLLAGHGPSWNAADGPVYGVTSPLHLLLVTALSAALPRLATGRLLQIASLAPALLAAVVLAVVCAAAARDVRLRRRWGLWALLVVPAVTLTEPFAFHAGTGMDTMLALLANTGVVATALAAAARPTIARGALAAAAAFVAVLARPEAVMLAGLVPPLAIALLGEGPRRRALLAFAAPFAALIAFELVLARSWLGTALPLAFHAKRPHHYGGFAGEYGWNPFLFLEVFLAAALPFVLALLLFTTRRSARVVIALLAPAVPTFAVLFWMNQIMGHLGRFFLPALPFFVVAAALAFDRWLQGATASARALVPRLALAAVMLVAGRPALEAMGRRWEAGGANAVIATPAPWRVPAREPLPFIDSWRASQEVAEVARRAPPGTRFAMSEHGLVSASAPDAEIVDVAGLHDRTFALAGFSAAELFRRAPDVIWLPHPDYGDMLRAILDDATFRREYLYYPDAFFYGLALRRGSPHLAALRALVDERWRSCYPGRPMADYLADAPGG
jgi:hypothetical protein